jgi:hypothetical protein
LLIGAGGRWSQTAPKVQSMVEKTLQKSGQLLKNTPKIWSIIKKCSKSASAVIVKITSKNALDPQEKL